MDKLKMIEILKSETKETVWKLSHLDATVGEKARQLVDFHINEIETDAIPSSYKEIADIFGVLGTVSAEEISDNAAQNYIDDIHQIVSTMYSNTILKKIPRSGAISIYSSLATIDSLNVWDLAEISIGGVGYNQSSLLSAWNHANPDQKPIVTPEI